MLRLFRAPTHVYTPVKGEEFGTNEKNGMNQQVSSSSLAARWRHIALILATLLLISLSANALFLYQRYVTPWLLYDELPTKFVGLSRTVGQTLVDGSVYSDPNRTVQDAAWDDPNLVSYSLYVALDEEYAMSMGLPHSQRWPWDASKGVYILYAAHEMHCVHVIRSVVNAYHDGVPEADRLWHYPHAVHCLDVLRESVMCNADDYPMYTGRVNANAHTAEPFAGNGMVKQCRDWDALMKWANEHSACYAPAHPREADYDELERYKFCPDGSRPWETGSTAA